MDTLNMVIVGSVIAIILLFAFFWYVYLLGFSKGVRNGKYTAIECLSLENFKDKAAMQRTKLRIDMAMPD